MLDLDWKQNLNKIYQLKKTVYLLLVHVIVLIYVIILIVDIPVSG